MIPENFNSEKPITFPCDEVVMVPVERVVANDWNPNKVATPEMEGLAHSIALCGFAQPVVTYPDDETGLHIVVDGFHRYVLLKYVFRVTHIPCAPIRKDQKHRMASTVRFNKAKGEHQPDLMGALIGRLMSKGLSDDEIARHLQMEPDEILRLKQIKKIA